MDTSKSQSVKTLKTTCDLLRERHESSIKEMTRASIAINQAILNVDQTHGFIPETIIESYERSLENERVARDDFSKAYNAWHFALSDLVGLNAA